MNQEEHSLNNLITALLAIKQPPALANFLQGLLTPSEIVELAQRLEIVKQLKQGIPQHKIARNLGVGVATVTRGARELKLGRFSQVDPWR